MDDITPDPIYSVDEITGRLEETGWEVDRQQPPAGPRSAVLARRA